MKEKKRRFPVGKAIAVVIIVLIIMALANPKLLFFLNPAQQEVVAQFQYTYFTSHMPIQTSESGFDPFPLLALDRAGIEIPFPQMVVHQGKD